MSLTVCLRTAQAFGHLAEMYFEGLDYDLGERELGYALAFDHELDNLSASLALISSCVSDIMKDEGGLLDLAIGILAYICTQT